MNLTKTSPTRITLLIAALLLAGVLLLCLIAPTSVARWLDKYAGIENESYKVYPTAVASGDFYGRVYAKIRTQPKILQTAGSPEGASAQAGFQVLSPQLLPEGFQPLDKYDVTGNHSYEIAINDDEARRILGGAGLPASAIPTQPALDKITVDIPASVVVHQSQGERWFTLIQGIEGHVRLSQGVDPAGLQTLDELGLRYLGLTEPEARQFSRDFGLGAFLVTPPTDMPHAESTSVNGAPALILYQSQADNSPRAVIWKANGVVYGLYGGLPVEELMKMAESVAAIVSD